MPHYFQSFGRSKKVTSFIVYPLKEVLRSIPLHHWFHLVACLLPVAVLFAPHLLMAPVLLPLLSYLHLSAASVTNDSAIFHFISYHFVHHIHLIRC